MNRTNEMKSDVNKAPIDALRTLAAATSALALAPVVAAGLLVRPAWREGFAERLGGVPHVDPHPIWLHAASVGEGLAAARLLDALQRAGEPLFVSLSTRTGRDVVRAALPGIPCALAPLDHPWTVATAMARIRPRALVLVEGELWPGLMAGAARAGAPIALVSGRISERSFERYRRVVRWIAPRMRGLQRIGARSERDAERFIALGAAAERVSITGCLKLDPPASAGALAGDLEHALGDTPLFVAGSTHPGEETAALQALTDCEAAGVELALVLAPRHPNRVAAVEREVRRHGRVVRRRSALEGATLAKGEVLLLDSLGELAAVYGRARVAFVGGSLAPIGGHNLLEPLQAGCLSCFGPHHANALEAARLLSESGAGRPVSSADRLGERVLELWLAPDRERRIERGRARLAQHRGSVARSLGLVRSVAGEGAGSRRDSGR